MENIDIGREGDDGSGDQIRIAFEKVNRNFAAVARQAFFDLSAKGLQTPSLPYDFVPRHLAQAAPLTAPAMAGAIWIDVTSGAVYLSVGTRSAADWRALAFRDEVQ